MYYKGRLINLKNITIRGFKTADNDLYIVGGDNSVGKVMIDGVTLIDSAEKGVVFGSGMYESVVSNVWGQRSPKNNSGTVGIFSVDLILMFLIVTFQATKQILRLEAS
ncbi:hypothetical protein QO179_07135 [Bacillus stercoris]|nr:hypothetical protein [Bacillus stercoris]